MLTTIAKHTVRLAMILVGLALVLDVLYFVHGSLEMFPTEEQQEKIRLVTGVLAVFLASMEIGLWLLLRHLGSPSASPGAAADGPRR